MKYVLENYKFDINYKNHKGVTAFDVVANHLYPWNNKAITTIMRNHGALGRDELDTYENNKLKEEKELSLKKINEKKEKIS